MTRAPPPTEVAALESAGLDAVWVAEAYGFDSPRIMGYLAARTERMRIGSAILNVYSRTPALIAQTAAGLDAISGGRAILGLGASGPAGRRGLARPPYDRPLGRTREVDRAVPGGSGAARSSSTTASPTCRCPEEGGTGSASR